MSLLLATGILAVGGLGLFMYKNSSEGESFLAEEETDKKDENWFDLRSFFGNSDGDEDDQKDDDEELDVYETKTPQGIEGPEAANLRARKERLGYRKGGSVSSASKRADGIAVKGKTRGKFI